MSILSIIPMFLGVVGGVLCYRAYMKSLELLAARQKDIATQRRKELIQTRAEYLNQDLQPINRQTDSDYESLRG